MKKNAVVTGAGSGIGRAVVELLLDKGYRVFAIDMQREQILESAQSNEQEDFYAVELDVRDAEKFSELAAKMDEKGGCDVLVNCAGVFCGNQVHQAHDRDYDFQFDVNMRGIFYATRALIPAMIKKNEGAIVNISSVSGLRGDYNAPLYCASKAAVIGFTRAIALDYAQNGVRINCVCPSATETPMFLSGTNKNVMDSFLSALPDHRLGKPTDVANAVYFLTSESASHINGQVLCVDGGLSAWNGQPRQDKE